MSNTNTNTARRGDRTQSTLTVEQGRMESGEYIVSRDGLTILSIWRDSANENERLAHLFAAAPELLEACKWFIDQLESGELVRDITHDGDPNWAMKMMRFTMELQKAQAVISKAEGRVA